MASDKYLEVTLLDQTVVPFLIFCESSILFSMVAKPIYILTNRAGGFSSLHTLTNICCLFDDSHSVIMAFSCNSLMISDVEYPIMCLLASCMSSLEKCQFAAHFSTG